MEPLDISALHLLYQGKRHSAIIIIVYCNSKSFDASIHNECIFCKQELIDMSIQRVCFLFYVPYLCWVMNMTERVFDTLINKNNSLDLLVLKQFNSPIKIQLPYCSHSIKAAMIFAKSVQTNLHNYLTEMDCHPQGYIWLGIIPHTLTKRDI